MSWTQFVLSRCQADNQVKWNWTQISWWQEKKSRWEAAIQMSPAPINVSYCSFNIVSSVYLPCQATNMMNRQWHSSVVEGQARREREESRHGQNCCLDGARIYERYRCSHRSLQTDEDDHHVPRSSRFGLDRGIFLSLLFGCSLCLHLSQWPYHWIVNGTRAFPPCRLILDVSSSIRSTPARVAIGRHWHTDHWSTCITSPITSMAIFASSEKIVLERRAWIWQCVDVCIDSCSDAHSHHHWIQSLFSHCKCHSSGSNKRFRYEIEIDFLSLIGRFVGKIPPHHSSFVSTRQEHLAWTFTTTSITWLGFQYRPVQFGLDDCSCSDTAHLSTYHCAHADRIASYYGDGAFVLYITSTTCEDTRYRDPKIFSTIWCRCVTFDAVIADIYFHETIVLWEYRRMDFPRHADLISSYARLETNSFDCCHYDFGSRSDWSIDDIRRRSTRRCALCDVAQWQSVSHGTV